MIEGIVKTEIMAIGRSDLLPAPREEERAMAAEEPQMKVAPDMIMDVWRSILSHVVPMRATRTKSEGVSIQDTKRALGASGLSTLKSMLLVKKRKKKRD